jgi:putative transcriptional regulator
MKTKLREYRSRKNWTQADVAEKVGVRRETIVFLEQGKYNPSLRLAYDLAVLFGVAIEELFEFED